MTYALPHGKICSKKVKGQVPRHVGTHVQGRDKVSGRLTLRAKLNPALRAETGRALQSQLSYTAKARPHKATK